MSVREQIYVRTDLSAADVATAAAEALKGLSEHRDGHSWLLVNTGHLVSGASGAFGGPILSSSSEAQFRPADEYEAPDAYNIEMRLWQAKGPRADSATGQDIEAAAASSVFAVLFSSLSLPMIHVRDGDKLISAALPGRGMHHFNQGVSVYDWDDEKWDGYVIVDHSETATGD